MIQPRFKLSPLAAAVLMHNVITCEDASNDADRTVDEIIFSINGTKGTISKSLLESALYCCNMNNERGEFWHPRKRTFLGFVKSVINDDIIFDEYYNFIRKKSRGPTAKAR